MNIMRTLALLGLAILFRVSPLCYWLRQRFFGGTWVPPHENLDSPRVNDYRSTVPVMSPSEP
jgi:hypothetical protein